jgi:transcriptional regulator with XRE-family HTH domain
LPLDWFRMPRISRLKLSPIDPGPESIGQRIARIRKERGYTQREVAERIGLIPALVSDYENDKLRLNADMILRFTEVLEVSADELLRSQPGALPGRKPSRKVLRRLEQIESLPRRKQDALLTTIDAFLSSTAG